MNFERWREIANRTRNWSSQSSVESPTYKETLPCWITIHFIGMYTEMSFDLDFTFSVLFATTKLTSKADAFMSSQRLAEYDQAQPNEGEYQNIQSHHSQSPMDLFTINNVVCEGWTVTAVDYSRVYFSSSTQGENKNDGTRYRVWDRFIVQLMALV